ncbi:hypothetical protein Tco_0661021, partial [Tanacetum coccineum]
IGLKWFQLKGYSLASTTKVDIEPQNGSNADITILILKAQQTLDVSAVLLTKYTEVHLAILKGRTSEFVAEKTDNLRTKRF